MNIHIGWPQGIVLGLYFLGWIIAGVDHKKIKEFNGWHSFIGNWIMLGLLFWGGFFNE